MCPHIKRSTVLAALQEVFIYAIANCPRRTDRRVEAEKKRRLELERAFNSIEDKRKDRIRTITEVAEAYFEAYKIRHKSITFAEHAIGHLKRIPGTVILADITDQTVKDYQTARLKEKAVAKTINEEVGFLLRLLEDQGDAIRLKMRRLKMRKLKTLKLAVRSNVARAFTPEEKAAMIAEARTRRSPHIVPALMLALHAGLRDAEIRGLQWERLDLERGFLAVGESKTDAGAGRTIPLNADLKGALVNHAKWYLKTFGKTRPEWYVFPFGKPVPIEKHFLDIERDGQRQSNSSFATDFEGASLQESLQSPRLGFCHLMAKWRRIDSQEAAMETAVIAEVLGGRKVLGKAVKRPDDLAQLVRDGLPAGSVRALGQKLRLGNNILSRKLGIPQRTLTRRLSERSLLTSAESDRTVRMARVFANAIEMIGDQDKAIQWLSTPNRALGGERPLDHLDTDVGAQMVEDILGRIAYGVYS